MQPNRREYFHIAIICALGREHDAVSLLFDRFWDEDGDPYGTAPGDTNTYITGRVGKYDVVLLLLPGMGKVSAAGDAATFRASYTRLELMFLVGVCGGVPRVGADDALLGDVVISSLVVQYDLGRKYPSQFAVKDTIEDSLSRPSWVERDSSKKPLGTSRTFNRPPLASADRLTTAIPVLPKTNCFRQIPYTDIKIPCDDGYCDEAIHTCLIQLGCEEHDLVPRKRLEEKRNQALDEAQAPVIFIGRIGSGDTVIKSGQHRDEIAQRHQFIAFEMGGAGAWEQVPCIVVKGICDYADSHKNKARQDFAAATAASVMRAVLDRYNVDRPRSAELGLAQTVSSQYNRSSWQQSRTMSSSTFGSDT
jgi:nucleoside phosphorylase